ncbi:MAG TPA: class I SAM-dependent methyltransferase [Candidatus Acidoferrales bacterium]|nr:class I SAM-dependent methyltransferase [Candidatus Acidoferrales bacterium]
MAVIEERKIAEAEFHNKLRSHALGEQPELYARLTSNKKWYSIGRKRDSFVHDYFRQHCAGARTLDFACGSGHNTFLMAEAGADATGIDISDISVANAQQEALHRGLQANFVVMDCENLDFPDSSFDFVYVGGVLHHLDLKRAYSELARVLKPSGSVLCIEALAHNLVFQAYRRLTPHLRTEYEAKHILGRRDVIAAKQHFGGVEWRFFYLTSLLAVPLRNKALFNPLLCTLETLDSALLSVPGVCWWAWQIAFILSQPKR